MISACGKKKDNERNQKATLIVVKTKIIKVDYKKTRKIV